jgi:hypothetical protein
MPYRSTGTRKTADRVKIDEAMPVVAKADRHMDCIFLWLRNAN